MCGWKPGQCVSVHESAHSTVFLSVCALWAVFSAVPVSLLEKPWAGPVHSMCQIKNNGRTLSCEVSVLCEIKWGWRLGLDWISASECVSWMINLVMFFFFLMVFFVFICVILFIWIRWGYLTLELYTFGSLSFILFLAYLCIWCLYNGFISMLP